MIGWIIYSAEDVEKNKSYIQMYVDKFKKNKVDIKLVIVEEIDNLREFIEENEVDFAINRCRNYLIAKLLEEKGIRVFNNSLVTKIGNNKGETYRFLKDVVPFMPTKYKEEILIGGISDKGFSYPFVIKSCGGHGGEEVFLVKNSQEELDAIKKMKGREYVVQECCSDVGKDVRVYIIGNKIAKAVLRTSTKSFKSNYSLGGNVEEYILNDEEKQMVKNITDKIFLDYAGVDFTFHKGRAVFNEIEDAVGARMLYQVSDIDIVQEYVEYIIRVQKNAEL